MTYKTFNLNKVVNCTKGAMTLNIMARIMMTSLIMTHIIMTQIIMSPTIMALSITINHEKHYIMTLDVEDCYADYRLC
jgi:hypothetical protein